MAHLWVEREAGQWAVLPLREGAHLPQDGIPVPFGSEQGAALGGDAAAAVLPAVKRSGVGWVVLAAHARTDIRVNGRPLALGIRVLKDRDAIGAGGARLFFSTECLPRLERFARAERAVACVRCQQDIREGDAVVRCPGCGAWHHMTEQFACWTYEERCAVCDQPTAMDAGYRWTPEDL